MVPLLAYTNPDAARDLLRFRHRTLPTARERAIGDVAARGALPVADDQRRGGVGVLPGRHRAVPHRRRRRLRHRPLRHGHRRHRVPPRRGRRDARRDGPAVRRPRLLRRGRTARVPHPRRDRTRRVHRRRRRQRVHERDGALHAALRGRRGQHARVATIPTPTARWSPPPVSADDEVDRVDARRRRDVRAVRLRARHQPPGRRLPRPRAVGLGGHARPRSTRCCSTSTRS